MEWSTTCSVTSNSRKSGTTRVACLTLDTPHTCTPSLPHISHSSSPSLPHIPHTSTLSLPHLCLGCHENLSSAFCELPSLEVRFGAYCYDDMRTSQSQTRTQERTVKTPPGASTFCLAAADLLPASLPASLLRVCERGLEDYSTQSTYSYLLLISQ